MPSGWLRAIRVLSPRPAVAVAQPACSRRGTVFERQWPLGCLPPASPRLLSSASFLTSPSFSHRSPGCAVDSYMAAIWERYVTPAGRTRAEKRGRAVKKAATVAAVAAGAVAVAAVPLLVGVARASNLPGYS